MPKRIHTLLSTIIFLTVALFSNANALILNISENVNSSFSGNYFHQEVSPIGGITDTFQFTSTGVTTLQFFSTVFHDQGAIGAPGNIGINNLIMTWSVGNIMHTITSAAGVVDPLSIPFFHTLADGETATLSISGIFRFAGGGYLLSVSALNAVPLPPSVIAFFTAMIGIGFLARRKKRLSA